MYRQGGSISSPRGRGSHAPNRFSSLANLAQEKLTWPPDCAYRRADNGGVPDSRPQRHWSMNWLKPNIPTNSAGRWAAVVYADPPGYLTMDVTVAQPGKQGILMYFTGG